MSIQHAIDSVINYLFSQMTPLEYTCIKTCGNCKKTIIDDSYIDDIMRTYKNGSLVESTNICSINTMIHRDEKTHDIIVYGKKFLKALCDSQCECNIR